MEQHEARDFIKNNTEALKHLSRIIGRASNIEGIETLEELKGRQRAVEIVKEWLTEVWGYTDEFPLPEEEEDLYKTLSEGRD